MRASFSPISLAGFLLAAAPLIQPAAALNLYSDFIFTREVTYCSAGRAVEVERFDIRYYRNNQSIGFDINARSTAPNLSADLNIQLFAYGKSYLNISANLCDILVGALCPLPQYQFDGTFAYILPDSVNIDLPSIAFSVPDLDAYAQVILTNQATGEEALCLGATLSNGKTVYDSRVGWAVGGLTIAAFVGALIHSFWPLTPSKSGPEWRFATILSYFQHVAMCGFLSLDYPVVYKNFTLNFAWAQGLIYMRPINAAINRMRYMTGGVDREGQTFSVIAENSVALFAAGRDNVVDSRNPGGSARSYAQAAAYTVPTVQDVPTYNLISGIETTAESLDITYPNAFMTVFIVFLLLLAVMTAICLLAALGVAIYTLLQRRKQSPSPMQPGLGARSNLRYFIWTNFLRIFLVAYTPLMIFIFWQFLHLFDSGWLAIFIAAITLVWLHLAILGIYWHLSKVSHAALNGGQEKTSLRWTTVSHQFKRSGYGYLLLLSGAAFISAAFVAFAQGHALVQVIPLIVVEVAVFLAFCIWRPFANRGANALMIIISIFKILAYGLLVAFYARLTYNGIIKAVLGFVLIAVQGIMTLVLFCVTVYNLFAGILWSRRARKEAEAENHAAMSERVERPAGPFIHPSYLSRGESYRPSDAMAGGRYEGQTSPTEEDPMYRPPVSQLHVPGTPDTAAEYAAPGQTYGADGPGLGLAPAAYPSRTEGASIDDSRTVVAPSSEGSNPAAPHKTGSRFNPKNWKKRSEDSV